MPAAADDEWKTIAILAEMPKASGDVIRVEQKSFKNRVYVSLRQYYQDRKTDEYKPGKNGITFTAEEFQQLREVLGGLELVPDEG